MKDTFSFREPIDYLSKEQQAFAESFADPDKRDCVIRLMNQGMSRKTLETIHVSPETDYVKLVTINRMNALLFMDGQRRLINKLADYGMDCNLPLRTLEAMSHALTTYRWKSDMVKKLAPLDESQIDVVMTGYMICNVHGADKFFKDEVMDPKLTVDEMMDKIASVSDKNKK